MLTRKVQHNTISLKKKNVFDNNTILRFVAHTHSHTGLKYFA